VAVNRPIAEALVADRGVPPDRVVTIHHAVAMPPVVTLEVRSERRRARRRELGLPEDSLVVGTFIRMHPQKRPMDVVAVARRLTGRGVHFLLVGGGSLDVRLDRELAARPVPNLTRLPLRDDTDDLYDALDLCLLTSAYEGLPVFLLDGLARGVPCVATDVGEVAELLADGGGVVVERPGDIGALAAAILSLAAPETRTAEGERGRAAVQARFGLERYVASYERAIFGAGAAGPTSTTSDD
jgi:glycosyltransferase involved in cell wall biosynthesis